MTDRLLDVDGLTIGFRGDEQPILRSVSFSLRRGTTLALVGESGSGKTLTCRAVMRILPPVARILSGAIHYHGTKSVDVVQLSERKLRRLRGDRIGMIFQEPMSALSPLHTIGAQTAEALLLHTKASKAEAKKKCLHMFERVGFPDPERAWRSYPFELSGGLRQRAMIAAAMVSEPDILIADEPTTALDVTTQAGVLGLIRELQQETGMGVILVTHDLGVVANMADDIVVLRRGAIMEAGPAPLILSSPGHGYTRKLIAAAPMIPESLPPVPPPRADVILEARGLHKTYIAKRGGSEHRIEAMRGIDLDVPRGRTLAVVGESGSGKSTFARVALGAEAPDPGGEVMFHPETGCEPIAVHTLEGPALKSFRRTAQMVFQDPYAALSPRMSIQQILTEPLKIHEVCGRSEGRDRAAEALRRVGLGAGILHRYPHAFSGGQRQRISIARALMLDPTLLVLDEPTSALDVSVQAQVLDLLEELKESLGLSYLFISHDLAVVARLADTVAVMRRGRIVEQAPTDILFDEPRHPYTRALIAASPEPDINRPIDLTAVAAGAGDSRAWPEAFAHDDHDAPPLVEVDTGHRVRTRQ